MTYAPKLVIHGGAGRLEGDVAKRSAFHAALDNIVRSTYAYLEKHSAHETAVYGIHLLEDNPLFNAGTGSKLQKDGTIRMSAAIMLGKELRFAGVVNVENVQHPIDLADHLLEEENTVLAGVEATQYARSMGLPEYDCLTETRHREYENRQAGKSGTVGVVALDPEGAIVAATSPVEEATKYPVASAIRQLWREITQHKTSVFPLPDWEKKSFIPQRQREWPVWWITE